MTWSQGGSHRRIQRFDDLAQLLGGLLASERQRLDQARDRCARMAPELVQVDVADGLTGAAQLPRELARERGPIVFQSSC